MCVDVCVQEAAAARVTWVRVVPLKHHTTTDSNTFSLLVQYQYQ